MQNNLVETIIGAAVIVVAAVFLTFAYRSADAGGVSDGYTVTAKVTNISGVSIGTDVRIAGIKVGRVSNLSLDPDTYEAVVSLTIEKRYELGSDTSMSVSSESLLGGNFISLQPGADFEDTLADGSELFLATGTVDLMSLIQQAIFGTGGGASTTSSSESSGGTVSPAGGAGAVGGDFDFLQPTPSNDNAADPASAGEAVTGVNEDEPSEEESEDDKETDSVLRY